MAVLQQKTTLETTEWINVIINGAHGLWLQPVSILIKVLNILDSMSTLQRHSNLDRGLDGAALLIPACVITT